MVKAIGNQREKIDEMLAAGLRSIWPDLKVIPAGGDFSKSGQRTLQIIPKITHIRIVGPGPASGSALWLVGQIS